MNERTSIFGLALLAASLLFAPIAMAQPPSGMRPGPAGIQRPGPPPFSRELFTPEMVMKYQRDIDLTAKQRTAITEEIKKTQSQVLDVQWQLEDEQQKLTELLANPRIDEKAALAQAELVLASERQLKLEHLGLLIRIKNQLTEEQQKKLRSHRRSHRSRPPK